MMKYNIYGKFQVEVIRQNDAWQIFRIGQGVKRSDHSVYIPDHASEDRVLIALDDAFHEFAVPGAVIHKIE